MNNSENNKQNIDQQNIIEKIQESFFAHIAKTLSLDISLINATPFLLNIDPTKQEFGDLNSTIALTLAKQLKRSPISIAKEIADTYTSEYIEKIEVAGAGFLNLFFSPKAISLLAQELYTQKENFFKQINPEKPDSDQAIKRISLEFISANPTGPLHFGHGRGGIIGDVLGNIFSFLGHQVTKEFYINDAGKQIAKLGESFKIRCQQIAQSSTITPQITPQTTISEITIPNIVAPELIIPDTDIPDIIIPDTVTPNTMTPDIAIPEGGYQGEYLITMAQDFMDNHNGAERLSYEPDSFFQEYAKEKLLKAIKETLDNYGITFDVWFSEKTLHQSGAITNALDFLAKHGTLYEKEGALWFASTQFGDDKDRVVRKTTGELTYVAADIAYMIDKKERGYTQLIMTLGHDHHGYVERLQGIKRALEIPTPLDIILYQLVKIKENGQQVRLSKRAGNIITLDDVIKTVGKDVARFFYLNRKADAQLEFDLELALKKSDENPVYYVQYALVRTGSILQKAKTSTVFENIGAQDAEHLGNQEILLLKKIAFFKELLTSISTTFQTHQLAYYVHELAQLFSSYYAKHKIIDLNQISQSRARLLLVLLMQNTLRINLELLGISRPERM